MATITIILEFVLSHIPNMLNYLFQIGDMIGGKI